MKELTEKQVQEAIELLNQGSGSFTVAKRFDCTVAELMSSVNKYQASKGREK